MDARRFGHIDIVRSLAIVGVIATHTWSHHFTSSVNIFIWNYLHFLVIAFVFCSAYVLYARYNAKLHGAGTTFAWYVKRLKRLVLPLYWYLVIHYGLWIAFPNFFQGRGLVKSWGFISQSVFLTGGADLNWLVLLFVQLTLLFPFVVRLTGKKAGVTVMLLAFVSSVLFLFVPPPRQFYRWVMWLPWLFVLTVSLWVAAYEKLHTTGAVVKQYLIGAGVSFGIFVLLVFVRGSLGRTSLAFVDHKYPPDIYYFSYAFGMTFFLLAASRLPFMQKGRLGRFWHATSRRAYPLYFIHYIVLDFILTTAKSGWFWQGVIVQFVAATVVSYLVVLGVEQMVAAVSPKLPGRPGAL